MKTYSFAAENLPSVTVTGINDSDDIVGVQTITPSPGTFYFQGYIFDDGNFTILNDPFADLFGGGTFANAINNSDEVVGYYEPENGGSEGFLYNSGQFKTIDFPNSSVTVLTSISDSGYIVGYAYTGSQYFGFIYYEGRFTVLNPPVGYAVVIPKSVNNAGDIVGYLSTTNAIVPSTTWFLYENGNYTTTPGVDIVLAINNANQIFQIDNRDRIIYQDGTSSSFSYPGAISTNPYAVNNVGQIIGSYTLTPGSAGYFLATPNTSPPALLTLARLSADVYNATPGGAIDQPSGIHYSLLPGALGSVTAGSFQANAYASPDDSQIVIAFRGTVPSLFSDTVATFKNLLADVSFGTGVVNANLLSYVEDAAQFVRSIETAYSDANITLTGHSLGGAIAQIVSEASGLTAEAFNAPGAGQVYGQLQTALGIFSTDTNSTYSGDTDFRVYGDQISAVGQPVAGSTISTVGAPNAGPTAPTSLLDFAAISNTHSIQTVIADLEAGYQPTSGFSGPNYSSYIPYIVAASAVLPSPLPGISLLSFSFIASALTQTFADPASGTSYRFVEQPGSPSISAVELPTLPGIASYDVSLDVGGTWSPATIVQPLVNDTLTDDVEGLEIVPLASDGQVATIPGSFLFGLTFATSGQVNGTLAIRNSSVASAAPDDFTGSGRSDILFVGADGGLATWQVDDAVITGGGNLSNPGAAWTYLAAGDFNGDGRSDILFGAQGGTLAIWEMNGIAITGGGMLGNPGGTFAVVGTGDFNGDGASDILFRDSSGNYAIWDLNGTSITGGSPNIGNPGGSYVFKGIGDFNGDGTSDILFEDASGNYATWLISGNAITGGAELGNPGPDYLFKGIGDFTGNGTDDILFQDTVTGSYADWDVVNNQVVAGGGTIGNPGSGWSLAAIGDYNGDGTSDLLFENSAGSYATWDLSGTQIVGGGTLGNPGAFYAAAPQTPPAARPELPATLVFQNSDGTVATWLVPGSTLSGGAVFGNPGSGWTALTAGDFGGNGNLDVLFRYTDGTLATWQTDGQSITGGATLGNPGTDYVYKGAGDFNGDGQSDILFQDTVTGSYADWDIVNNQVVAGGGTIGNPGGSYAFKGIGDFNGDGRSDILFEDANGGYANWEMSGTQIVGGGVLGNPGGSYAFKGIGDFNGDGKSDILFEDANGNYASWDMSGTSIVGGGAIGNPGPGFQFAGIADLNGDNKSDIVFKSTGGGYASWQLNDTQIIGGSPNIGNPGTNWSIIPHVG